MKIQHFFDEATYTLTYVVFDPSSKDAVIIDPVLDFDPLRWRTGVESTEKVKAFVDANNLQVHWILDTHAHADHLSGMSALKGMFANARTAIGENIRLVQKTFAAAFQRPDVATDGRQWDHLLADREIVEAGSLKIEAIHTPGHTPACLTYHLGDALFTGDALFMPDYGTGRCDFPHGSADALYEAVKNKLYVLPGETRVFVGHDYQPNGRELRFETTIEQSKESNIHLPASRSKADFVAMREERDATLAPPRLILQSLQVNIAAGELPPEEEGRRFMKMPLQFLGR